MSATSLWPEFKFDTKLRGMNQILLEAGADISEKTNGIIGYSIESHATSDGLSHRCMIFVQGHRYRIELYSVETGHTNFPAALYSADGVGVENIPDEASLRTHLEKIFNSDRTKQIVQNLIANFG
ncbi:MAG: hypothetical protein ABGY75_04105 [Gemmataceae bacterium]